MTRIPAAESFDEIARRMRAIQREESRQPVDFFEAARREVAGAPSEYSYFHGQTDYDAATLTGLLGWGQERSG